MAIAAIVTKRRLFVVASLSAALFLSPSPSPGLDITVSGSLGDLDGDGDGGAGEDAVVAAAVACWEARITTDRAFTLNVVPMSLAGTTRGTGIVDSLDGADIPNSGTINIDNDGSTAWYVDPAPLDSLEFTPDPALRWRFINGPAGSDLLRVILHETGHALGWLCGDSCGSAGSPRYDALMVPAPDSFVSDPTCTSPFPTENDPPFPGCVDLVDDGAHPLNVSLRGDGLGGSGSTVVNELSHPGVRGNLMHGVGVGGGTRELPSEVDVDLFRHAYGDTVNLPPTVDAGNDVVSECNSAGGSLVTLDASGSTDPEGATLTYGWACPAIALSDPASATPEGFFPLGGPVTCRVDVTDLAACAPDADTVNVTVVDTTAPAITAPADVTTECTSPAGTPVALGSPVASDVCDAGVAVSNDAPALFPLGATTVTWSATDDSGNTGTDTRVVNVVDTTPPELTVSVSPTALWAPNHVLVTVNATIAVSDVCDAAPVVRLVSIISNEPDDGLGDGDTESDIQGASFDTDDRTFQLRAERSGLGGGRVYTITYVAEDGSGNTTTRTAEVTVPKSQGQ